MEMGSVQILWNSMGTQLNDYRIAPFENWNYLIKPR
jgi:hypothetical protein